MQIVTNEARARAEQRKGNGLLIAAMLAYLAGFGQAWLVPANPYSDALSIAGLVLGTLLWLVSQSYVRRVGPRYRQDAALDKALKGLDNRYTLLHFPDAGLPDHLLVGPAGVRVLVPRGVPGRVRCRDDRWSRPSTFGWLGMFGVEQLGNPTRDAARGVTQVTQRLGRALDGEQAAAAPVGANVVFTHPNVQLEIESCRYPVARGRELRAQLQRDKGSLRPPELARLRQALEPQRSSAAR
ncbi:MAG TPA: hypothetical protein VFE37_22560 [Chloroflexota bacterium]|nr:hypothetical protein [Chloroflexota bacterium]